MTTPLSEASIADLVMKDYLDPISNPERDKRQMNPYLA
jgi:hypothetical protein